MKKEILLVLLCLGLPYLGWSQCTTTDATACQCLTSSQTDCDLLPDITISGWAITNYLGGPTEYSQNGNGQNDGRLRLSGSTPNIGVGPFTVGAEQLWTCGPDTFNSYSSATAVCQYPQQLIKQKVYHKNGNTMSYSERWAGSMTYHPTHGHMHVDDWATFSLRVEDPNEPDARNWPIVGTGAKVGFCLMDYGTCSYYSGHCRDAQDNILLNSNFVNYGLGGGQYNCSPVEQGISVGHTDIYSENLDGMWIDIPPGTCNGDYYIVIEVDPNDYFLESDETNNWTAVPFTLTQQQASGNGSANVSVGGSTTICSGETLTLTAEAGTSYTWSEGSTSQSIAVTASGSYTVTVAGPCGQGVSTPIVVNVINTAQAPAVVDDVVCMNGNATLSASGTGDFYWYDAATGGNMVGTGASFTTPSLTATSSYYVERSETILGSTHYGGPMNASFGGGSYHTNNTRYLEFDAHEPFTLVSAWVDADGAGNRDIELRDDNGYVLASASVYMPNGQSRVTLNLNVPIGNNLRLGLSTSSLTDLFRNDNNVNYPYAIGSATTITSSSAGSNYYYFFYDWEVKLDDLSCSTPRSTATATVSPNPSVSITGLASNFTNADPIVNMVGVPAGGTFTGSGVSGNTFDPALAGIGGPYTITYTYTDGNGCTGFSEQLVSVSPFVSVLDGQVAGNLEVFPNPNQGRYTLNFELLKAHQLSIVLRDLSGKTVMEEQIGKFMGKFSREYQLSGMAKGVYLLEVKVDDRKFHQKLVYQ